MITSFQVGDIRIGADDLFLIAGPCVIESEEHAIRMAEIIKGDGIQAAADRLGVSLATARTHLRHVFDKTGTQRQAELVGLAMNGHALLCEDA